MEARSSSGSAMTPKVRHVGFDLVADDTAQDHSSQASGAVDIPPTPEYDYTVGKSISPVIIPPVLSGVRPISSHVRPRHLATTCLAGS